MEHDTPPVDDTPQSLTPAPSLPDEAPDTRRARNRWLRVVDFSRPTKFGPDQEQRMRRLHESFTRLAQTRMAGQLRLPLEMEFIDTSQRTWRDAYGMVPSEAACAILRLEPYGTPCLMAVEMPLLLLAVDKLLGSDDNEHHERKLTEIDATLIRRVLSELASALTLTWQELGEVEFIVDGVESEVDAAQTVQAAEPSLVVAMEARLGSVSSAVVLLLPHASVHPLVVDMAQRSAAAVNDDGASALAIRDRVSEASVIVRAELGSAVMGANQVLALRPGDRVRLVGPPPGEADLVVDDIAVTRVRAGHHGHQRAVQIETPIEEVTA